MERIRLLDVLRGMAIIGTLGINIWIFALVNDFKDSPTNGDLVYLTSFDAFIQTRFFCFCLTENFSDCLQLCLEQESNLSGKRTWQQTENR